MVSINRGRVWLGGLVGGLVWVIWSLIVNLLILGPRYAEAQEAGQFLAQPRYGFFMVAWIIILLMLGTVVSMLYASVRTTCGAGPCTALFVGLVVGFAAGVPTNFGVATWSTFDRIFPLWWMLELWLGAVFAALAAGWLYRETAE